MDGSESQLDVLGVLHWVVAGFVALFGLLPLIHVAMGVGIITGSFPFGAVAHGSSQAFPRMFGWFFVVLGAGFLCAGLSLATALGFAGTYLRQRRRWLFCVVVDAIACSLLPFGTVLGVVSLVMLSQPEVKARFA